MKEEMAAAKKPMPEDGTHPGAQQAAEGAQQVHAVFDGGPGQQVGAHEEAAQGDDADGDDAHDHVDAQAALVDVTGGVALLLGQGGAPGAGAQGGGGAQQGEHERHAAGGHAYDAVGDGAVIGDPGGTDEGDDEDDRHDAHQDLHNRLHLVIQVFQEEQHGADHQSDETAVFDGQAGEKHVHAQAAAHKVADAVHALAEEGEHTRQHGPHFAVLFPDADHQGLAGDHGVPVHCQGEDRPEDQHHDKPPEQVISEVGACVCGGDDGAGADGGRRQDEAGAQRRQEVLQAAFVRRLRLLDVCQFTHLYYKFERFVRKSSIPSRLNVSI